MGSRLFDIKIGSTADGLEYEAEDYDETGLPFAGATDVKFRAKDAAGTVVIDSTAATVTSAGLFQYSPQTGDISAAQALRGEFWATVGGKQLKRPRRGFINFLIGEDVS